MKSKLLAIAMAVLVVSAATCVKSYAMPSGADSDTSQLTKVFPAEWSLPPDVYGVPLTFGFGSTTDFVIDRNLEDSSDLSENVWTGGNIYWDPHSKVHLDLFLGTAWMKVGTVAINNNTTTKVSLTADGAFAVGGSAKVDITEFQVIPEQPAMKLFAGGGYRFTNPDVDSIHASFDAVSEALNIEINEWSATLGVSQRINDPIKTWFGWGGLNFAWVPYVGVQYTDLDLNISGTSDLPTASSLDRQSVKTGHLNSDDVVNVVVGMQIISFDDKLSIGLEGRFIAETAVSLNGHFRW